MNKQFVITGTILVLLAIVLGAFGAHGLKQVADADAVASFETGVRYQHYSGFAFLILGFVSNQLSFNLKPIYALLLSGTLLFSVSIYFLALQQSLGMELKFLGPVTPIGGTLLIIGWTLFLVKLIRQ